MNISFVIPAYNECPTLEDLIDGIDAEMQEHEHEIIVIDDGSTDDTPATLERITKEKSHVFGIRFDKNRGKSAALATGFDRASGDIIVTLDADLQDDPKEVTKLLAALDDGADLVCGWKEKRQDPLHKTLPSRVYNSFTAGIFGLRLHDINCGYKAMKAEVAKSIHLYGDRHRLIPVLAANKGYRLAEVAVVHHARKHGHSKYGLERFSKGAADVMSLWFLTKYEDNPGHFFFKWGAFFCGMAVVVFASSSLLMFQGMSPDRANLNIFLTGVAGLAPAIALAGWAGLSFGFGLLSELVVARAKESEQKRDG